MKYDLFLFDADDTLFDFKSSERLAFANTLSLFQCTENIDALYATYCIESSALWQAVEQGKVAKEVLKAERFRRTFLNHQLELPADEVGHAYLEVLTHSCPLMDSALALCQALSQRGRIGIITNGFEMVQTRRLEISGLAPYVSFMVVSEQCGFAKPDIRFFEHTASLISGFDKKRTLVIGDRLETDIIGAHQFGVDACWFNPKRQTADSIRPKFEIDHLLQLLKLI